MSFIRVLVCLCFFFVLSEQRPVTRFSDWPQVRQVQQQIQQQIQQQTQQPTQQVVPSGFGGAGGTPFNDNTIATIYGQIRSVTLFTCTGSNSVCGISVTHAILNGTDAGTTVNHGTTTGAVTPTTFPATNTFGGLPAGSMPPQERIVSANGTSGTQLNSLTLTTNLGRSVTAGSAAGTAFSQSSSGQILGWFSGSAGSSLDNIAFNWIGPLVSNVYFPDGKTFELSSVDPYLHPVTSFTQYFCTIEGQTVPYLCGVTIKLSSGEESAVAGVTSFSKGTVNAVTVPIPASAQSQSPSQSQKIQMNFFIFNIPTVGYQICGMVVAFSGIAPPVTFGNPELGIQSVKVDYSTFSDGVVFRGFKGIFTWVDGIYPHFQMGCCSQYL